MCLEKLNGLSRRDSLLEFSATLDNDDVARRFQINGKSRWTDTDLQTRRMKYR